MPWKLCGVLLVPTPVATGIDVTVPVGPLLFVGPVNVMVERSMADPSTGAWNSAARIMSCLIGAADVGVNAVVPGFHGLLTSGKCASSLNTYVVAVPLASAKLFSTKHVELVVVDAPATGDAAIGITRPPTTPPIISKTPTRWSPHTFCPSRRLISTGYRRLCRRRSGNRRRETRVMAQRWTGSFRG